MRRTRPSELSREELRRLRTRSQLLAGPRGKTALDAVDRLVGVQAQDSVAAAVGIRARTEALGAGALRRAIAASRSVVTTWVMRGTLHTVAGRDVRWIVALMGPRFFHRYRSARLRLGLDDALVERAIEALPAAMRSSGPITRGQLVQRLDEAGVGITPTGQAPAHLVVAASLRGILCRGPDARGGKATYVLLDEWIRRPGRTPRDPLAELARRYLAGHGPSTVSDFASWSGLSGSDARHGIERVAGDFGEVLVGGERAWFRDTPAASSRDVRFLGGFDSYLLAYRNREFALDRRRYRRVHPGGGMIRPVVLVDGGVAGTWRRHEGRLLVECFDGEADALTDEASELQRFLDGT